MYTSTNKGDKWVGSNRRFTYTLQSSLGVVGRVYTIKAVTSDDTSPTFLGSERTLAEDWSEGSQTELPATLHCLPSSSWVALVRQFYSGPGERRRWLRVLNLLQLKAKGRDDDYATLWYDGRQIPVAVSRTAIAEVAMVCARTHSTKACSQSKRRRRMPGWHGVLPYPLARVSSNP